MSWINWLFPPRADITTPNHAETNESATPSQEDKALQLLHDYFESNGGLSSVIALFEEGGFVSKVRSWISTGPNQPINSVEAGQLFGRSDLSELAKKADLPVDELKELLAKFLPVAVDRATPEGKL
ncbi:MAG: YidB family protein [Methylocystis sp.]